MTFLSGFHIMLYLCFNEAFICVCDAYTWCAPQFLVDSLLWCCNHEYKFVFVFIFLLLICILCDLSFFSFHLLNNMGFTNELNIVWYKMKKKKLLILHWVKLSCKGTQYFNNPSNPSNLFISFLVTISNEISKTLNFSNYHLI